MCGIGLDVLDQPARLLTANSATSNLGSTVLMTGTTVAETSPARDQAITLFRGGPQRISVGVTRTRLQSFY